MVKSRYYTCLDVLLIVRNVFWFLMYLFINED